MAQRILDDRQKLKWWRLLRSENVGPATFRRLINMYGSAEDAIEALPELSRRGGMKRTIRLYDEARAARDVERAHAFGAKLVAAGEPGYPPLIARIDGAPPLLFVKGDLELAARDMIAIVGARNASALGRKFSRSLAAALGEAGHAIISGLARGIDTAAHEASLETGTLAVLAGGIDHVYPPQNAGLFEEIAVRGLLISEMPPGDQPQARDFPRRNRLISGAALGVVIVEAAGRSGSLITARFAAEQGREVFAVPGAPLDPRAAGTNKLLKDGAIITTSATDVLDALASPHLFSQAEKHIDEPEADTAVLARPADIPGDARRKVLDCLASAPVDIDDLSREAGVPVDTLHMILIELELASRITRQGAHAVALA